MIQEGFHLIVLDLGLEALVDSPDALLIAREESARVAPVQEGDIGLFLLDVGTVFVPHFLEHLLERADKGENVHKVA